MNICFYLWQTVIRYKLKRLRRPDLLPVLLAAVALLAQAAAPAWAQSPDEGGGEDLSIAGQEVRQVVVALRPPTSGPELRVQAVEIAQTQAAVLQALPAQNFQLLHRFESLPGLVGQVDAAGLETLRAHPEVWAVAPDLPVEAALTESVALIKADTVWQALGFTGAGTTVAVLDTGVDSGHPDLAGAVVAEHCFHRDGGCPPDGQAESSRAMDGNGHGTHIAGIIASRGQVSPPGVAPEAGIVAIRVLQDNGSGFVSDVLAGLDWVLANQAALGVRVVNLSLGGGAFEGICDQASANAMLYAAAVESAHEAGITLFAASGNRGFAEQMMLPACISNVVAVGSTYDTDYDFPFTLGDCTDPQATVDQVTCSSNSSSALDLLAPGVFITSTGLNGGTSSQSGTSMSTAHASGLAALMLEAHSDLSPDELERIMKETGIPITDLRNGRVTPRIDALAAVSEVAPVDLVTISGTVLLEGRTDYSGTQIFLTEPPCSTGPLSAPALMTTGPDGSFEITRPATQTDGCLQAVHAGYLMGQQASPAGDLGPITLPGGDINQDHAVDILDLALLASTYKTTDPTADVNANGFVDLLDLILVASNYKRQGPVLWGATQ